VASTGTGDQRLLRAGHFYRRLSQTVGARHLYPDVGAALDIGAQQIRCAVVEPRSGVRRYFLTSRCASWDGDLVNRSGVCDGLAAHVVALLRRAQAHGPVALIGGMVRNEAFVATLRERLAGSDLSVQLMVSPEGLYAGSYGAALLAARRYQHLSRRLGRDRAMPYTEMLRQIH
jgi:activator of 2-hydroxyglutaryl-CoA dehydratase